MLPRGYRIDYDPVRLVGPDGTVIAQEGDFIISGDAHDGPRALSLDHFRQPVCEIPGEKPTYLLSEITKYPEAGADEAMALPSHESNAVPDSLMVDQVSGDREAGCVWLLDEVGARLAALWPSGWQAQFDPLRIYDSQGAEVAREGRILDIGGGPSPVHVDGISPECRVGDQAWWVSSVQTGE